MMELTFECSLRSVVLMITLRCTQKLLKRLGVPKKVETSAPMPTNVLGDWYANLLHIERQQLVLCMNERSLLVVLVPAKDGKTLPARMRSAVLDLLKRIGVSDAAIEAEANAMREISIAPTASKRVLGCMNDATLTLRFHMEEGQGRPIKDLEDIFSTSFYTFLDYRFPMEHARALFEAAAGREIAETSLAGALAKITPWRQERVKGEG